MTMTILTSNSQLDGILAKSTEKLSVIDFHATWCGPCHAIAPTFEALSKKHTNVNFLKCDVDQAKEIASRYQVSAMPTFVFLKGSTKVDQVRGADKSGLENTVQKHASSSSSAAGAFPGQGKSLSGASAPAAAAGGGNGGIISDIYGYYAGLDPQIKILVWVVLAYVGLMKLA